MDGWLPILFLAVILKIPVFAGMYIVWYAVKAEPEPETEDAPGNETDHGFRRWRREPAPPRGPRRGPHGGGAVATVAPARRRTEHDPRAGHHRGHPVPRSR